MIELQSGRYLLRRPALLQALLDLAQQPREPRQLGRLRPPRSPLSPAFGCQRAIALPAPTRPDLPAHRRRRTTKLASDHPPRLARRDPATDPLTLPERQPMLR